MGLFDFLKSKPEGPTQEGQQRLERAVEALAAKKDRKSEAALEHALRGAILLLGVRDVPPSVGDGPTVLEEDTPVAVLESSKATGERVLFAFTSPEQVRARSAEAGMIGLESQAVLAMIIEDGFDLLAINPGGLVVELSRDEVAAMLQRAGG